MNTTNDDLWKINYVDYLLWPGDERWELIEGVPHSMRPAPSRIHQEILMEIAGRWYTRKVMK